jgi:hypothetical protein
MSYTHFDSDDENMGPFIRMESAAAHLRSPIREVHPATRPVWVRDPSSVRRPLAERITSPRPATPTPAAKGKQRATRRPNPKREFPHLARGEATKWNYQENRHSRNQPFQPYPSRDEAYARGPNDPNGHLRHQDVFLTDLVKVMKAKWRKRVQALEVGVQPRQCLAFD